MPSDLIAAPNTLHNAHRTPVEALGDTFACNSFTGTESLYSFAYGAPWREPYMKGKRTKHRQQDSIYQCRYRIVSGERHSNGYFLCLYCGEPADTKDHVPPLSRVGDYEQMCLVNPLYLLVPACGYCNNIAGDTLQDSLLARVEYVKDRIAKREKVCNHAAEWDEDEIAELGPRLQAFVRAAGERHKRAMQKVEYYAGLDIVLELVDI